MGSYQDLYNRLKDDWEALQTEISKATSINREIILVDLVRQSQTYATWGYLLSLAETDAKRLKLSMEDALSVARKQAVAVLKEAEEKVTIAAKDDIAKQDVSYKQVQEMHIIAVQRVSIFKRILEALNHKCDMLQSLNSRQKSELSVLPEDAAVWQQQASPGFMPGEQVLAPTNHVDVEDEVADLAKQYRSKRRKIRNEE